MDDKPRRDDHGADAGLDVVRVDLAQRSARSGAARVGARGAQMAFGIASAMILARLLTPDDFGLLVLANFFVAFVNSFRDLGLKMATVHHDDLSQDQISALFWINAKFSVVVVVFMFVMAPVFGWLYHDARLTPVIAFLALGVLALSLTTQHEAVMMRQMRFELLASIEAATLLLGMVGGLVAAVLGLGYWALVLQILLANLSYSAAICYLSRWRPSRSIGPVSIRPMLRYGGNHTVYNILISTSDKLDRALVGLVSGVAAAGLYQNAFRWAFTPVQQVYAPLESVAVASMSRVRQDANAYRRAYSSGLLPVFSLVLPMLAFMAAESETFILTLLGTQWVEAIPLFRWLSVAAIAAALSQVTSWLYLSQGTTHRQLRWGFIAAPLTVLGILAGMRWGALGVAVTYTITRCLLAMPEIAFCLYESPLGFRDYFAPAWRPVLATLAALAALALVQDTLPERTLLVQFATRLTLFGVAYVIVWLLLPGGRTSAGRLVGLTSFRRTRRDSQPAVPPASV